MSYRRLFSRRNMSDMHYAWEDSVAIAVGDLAEPVSAERGRPTRNTPRSEAPRRTEGERLMPVNCSLVSALALTLIGSVVLGAQAWSGGFSYRLRL